MWLKVNKLSLDVQNTKAMVFHTSQKKVCKPKIYIDEYLIEYADEFNYLGIFLDKHLTWKNHISLTKQKLARISGIMNKLKFFLPKTALITLYNSLVFTLL